jgi:hypothetical protein
MLRLVTACLVALSFSQPAPVLFGDGVLSDGEIYRGSFAPDGDTFYFFKAVGGPESYRIYASRRSRGRWSTPERVSLGGEHSDLYPSISRDGRRMAFASFRPAPAATGKPTAYLWYVDRRADGWGAPVFMAAVNLAGHYHSWVEFGHDGRVYFRRTSPDGKATRTLATRWNGREYGAPEVYEEAERWRGWRADVNVVGGSPGPDGGTVFLDVATRNPATGRGASDIWVSIRNANGWTDPCPLGAGINTDGYDVFPFFSPDGRELYFVRDFRAFYRIGMAQALASVVSACP